jgi:ubiquinone/menaquinone biosynthesis C-methylase UbiE
MKDDLKKIIEHENANWSKIFQIELEKNSDKKFSSFWWENYYDELMNGVNKIMLVYGLNTILEAGSGSGKATLLLNKKIHKTLLDISPVALEYAKHTANKFEVSNINFVEGDIFLMPFKNNNFDFVWNIGVIEHYELDDIKSIIKEMIRVCNKSGIVAVGMPNFYSGPILKARLLKLLKFIPGYKLDTEKFYERSEIERIFKEVSKESGRKITYLETKYFGNPLIMETPMFILKTIGGLISRLFRKNKFLILIICKFE